jgi:hypothetical protein
MICPCCVTEECECRNPCHYDLTVTGEEPSWPAEVTAQLVRDDCDSCSIANDTDIEDNPLNVEQQFGLGSNNKMTAEASADANTLPFGGLSVFENYVSGLGDYEENKGTSYFASFFCEVIDDVAVWSVFVSYTYSHTKSVGNPTTRFQSTFKQCNNTIQISDSCPNPCEIIVALTPDGITINDEEYEWDCSSDTESCTDYDENGESPCNDFLNAPSPGATFTLACREECEFP